MPGNLIAGLEQTLLAAKVAFGIVPKAASGEKNFQWSGLYCAAAKATWLANAMKKSHVGPMHVMTGMPAVWISGIWFSILGCIGCHPVM